jgi:hypothetical protein
MQISDMQTGDLVHLANGELVLVEEIRRATDASLTLRLTPGRGAAWWTAPMAPTAQLQGRLAARPTAAEERH